MVLFIIGRVNKLLGLLNWKTFINYTENVDNEVMVSHISKNSSNLHPCSGVESQSIK